MRCILETRLSEFVSSLGRFIDVSFHYHRLLNDVISSVYILLLRTDAFCKECVYF
jgi:hypothetical protein